MKSNEVRQAVERGIKYGLLRSSIEPMGMPRISDKHVQSDLAEIIGSTWIGPHTGFCQIVVIGCIEEVKDYLRCDAWPTFGWVTDINKQCDFWKMDPDELCKGLTSGTMTKAEFHAWITLDTGEVIDPVIYPTLSELFPDKFRTGKGKVNMHAPEGHQYADFADLPKVQYRPSVFCG